MSIVFKGPVFSLPMFFSGDGEIDFAALGKYLRIICSVQGVQAVYSMAYNTRYPQLTNAEVVQVNQFALDICRDHDVFFIHGHPHGADLRALLDYTNMFRPDENTAISVLFPERYFGINDVVIDYHLAPTSQGHQILLHEMKLISGFDGSLVDWPLSLIEVLLNKSGVIGIKEDSKNDALTVPLLENFSETKNIIVAGGGKARAMALVGSGLKTWLNGSLMMFPELTSKFTAAFVANDHKYLELYMANLELPLFSKIISQYGWHVGHKAVLHVRGFCEYVERSPMPVLSELELNNVKENVDKICSDIGLSMRVT